MDGKLTKRNGRSVEPTELGQLVFKYAGSVCLVWATKCSTSWTTVSTQIFLFDVGVADALSKRLVSKILMSTISEDNGIHLRCFESTHEMLLEQLSQHKLDMILSDCPVDSVKPGLFLSWVKRYELSARVKWKGVNFPAVLEQKEVADPGQSNLNGAQDTAMVLTLVRS